jgi:hypothetical protein
MELQLPDLDPNPVLVVIHGTGGQIGTKAANGMIPGAVMTSESAPAAQPTPVADSARRPRLRPIRRSRLRLKRLIPAWVVSVLVHAAILMTLAAATVSSQDSLRKVLNIDSALALKDPGAEAEVLQILADPADIPRTQAVGDEHETSPGEPPAGDVGSSVAAATAGNSSPTPRFRGPGRGSKKVSAETGIAGMGELAFNRSVLSHNPVAPALDLGGRGMIAGDPGQGVNEIGEALDQLAREILRHLKLHKLTVVWLFDESFSMKDDQAAILEKFDRVTTELKLGVEPAPKPGAAAKKKVTPPLTHAIVGFGKEIDMILDKPTPDIGVVGKAIRQLKVDASGKENTMRAIKQVVDHFAGLIRKDRKLLIVLVTDESGDDGDDIEEARQALKSRNVPLYVIGRQSIFGFPFAHHLYEDKTTKDVYFPVIRRGPESADVEMYQWDGLYERWDEQPSGFAPYELARLTKESGGIYFLLPSEEFMRTRKREKAYSIAQMKEFMPEYDNRLSYVEKRKNSLLRRNLHDVVNETKNFRYRYEFPIDTQALMQAAAEEGDKATQRLNSLIAIQARLEQLAKAAAREPERRWRAHYDLMLASTVAFQVKAYEYRALMASILKAPPSPTKPAAPGYEIFWHVDHSPGPLAPRNETAKKYAEAERLLKKVIADYPKTPWADLAKDVLDRGLSVTRNEWHRSPKYREREQYVPKY